MYYRHQTPQKKNTVEFIYIFRRPIFTDCWCFAYSCGCNFVNASVLIFSKKSNSFEICYSRGCKFARKGFPPIHFYHENWVTTYFNESTVFVKKNIKNKLRQLNEEMHSKKIWKLQKTKIGSNRDAITKHTYFLNCLLNFGHMLCKVLKHDVISIYLFLNGSQFLR